MGTGISDGIFLLLLFCGRTVGDAGPYKNMRKIKIVTPERIVLINEKIIPIPRGNYSAIKKAFWELQYEGQED